MVCKKAERKRIMKGVRMERDEILRPEFDRERAKICRHSWRWNSDEGAFCERCGKLKTKKDYKNDPTGDGPQSLKELLRF